MGREMGGRLQREGMYVYLRLIPGDVWQKPTQFYKAIIIQLKIHLKLKKKKKKPTRCQQGRVLMTSLGESLSSCFLQLPEATCILWFPRITHISCFCCHWLTSSLSLIPCDYIRPREKSRPSPHLQVVITGGALEEIMAKNSPSLTKNTHLHIQEVHWMPSRINSKSKTYKPTTIKLERQRQRE